MVKLLCQRGAEKTRDTFEGRNTPVSRAVFRGNTRIVAYLLDGTDIEEKGLEDAPLLAAAKKGHFEVVRLLLERGAQLEAVDDDDKETPDV